MIPTFLTGTSNTETFGTTLRLAFKAWIGVSKILPTWIVEALVGTNAERMRNFMAAGEEQWPKMSLYDPDRIEGWRHSRNFFELLRIISNYKIHCRDHPEQILTCQHLETEHLNELGVRIKDLMVETSQRAKLGDGPHYLEAIWNLPL